LPDNNKYQGVILKDAAIKLAKFSKIIMLDDDHPFIFKYSLAKYFEYLNYYDFVRGRVIGPTGIPQLFLSSNAQGPNYGLTKELYLKIGGFAQYLYENSYGEDNDILMRIYNEFKNSKRRKACYAGEIVTKDLASNRWIERSNLGYNNDENQNNPYKRQAQFIKDFQKEYVVHPFKNNPSRKKIKWVKLPSFNSYFSEIKYFFVYLYYLPFIIFKKIQNKIIL